MVDVTSIIKLSFVIAKIPSRVKVNESQCRLLVDRILSLSGHLERMQDLRLKQKLEETHEDALVRAYSVLAEAKRFMMTFEDVLWMRKALFREKHRETFKELHESLTHVFQTLHLEIDYHQLIKKNVQAETMDVAHMEEQLAQVASSMEKLERSVTEMTDDSKKQHADVMSALKDIRVYRQTLNQDQLKDVLAAAREDESFKGEESPQAPRTPSPLGIVGRKPLALHSSKLPLSLLGAEGDSQAVNGVDGILPKVPQGEISTAAGGESGRSVSTAGRPPMSLEDKPPSSIRAAQARPPKTSSVGPSLHIKPFSQSFGVGPSAGAVGSGWFDGTRPASEAVVGEGGAKRGEYEVSFGEGLMGLSLKNVEARAEVSKVEDGGAAQAAGVRPGDNIVGINGRIPLGYTQIMGTMPLAPRPIRIRFIRGQGVTISPNLKKAHASTWCSNAVTAGVHHPAGDKGVLLEMYTGTSFSEQPWVRSEGWDGLPLAPKVTENGDQSGYLNPECTLVQKDATGVGKEEDPSNVAGDADNLSRWSGVRVGRAGKVIEIHLPGNNMHGILPPSIGSLEELRAVELRENRLEGNIPESLRYLQKLQKVDLSHNLLEGSIPAGDARWISTVSVFLLNNNTLSGHIPSTLGRLVNLTQLDLSFNGIRGIIPSELSSSRSLEILSLACNAITGTLPGSLGKLTRLKVLNVSNNKLAGPLPRGLGQLTSLEELRLNQNSFSGSIPDDMLASASLLVVDLSSNCLEGKIPTSLGARLENLTELNISKNSLLGEIPSNVGGMLKLKKLNLEKNTIEGALPTSLADLKALEELNFSNNVFTGPLVHIQWGNLSKLEHLHLANNKLEGSLPPSLGSVKSLVSLTLSANRLSGNIPRELHDLTDLKLLDLSGNKIAPSKLTRASFFGERRTLKKKLSACDVRF